MKRYREKDLKNFERDYLGRIICPSGDYTAIKYFKECCIFDKDCYFNHYTLFAAGSVFEKSCYFGNSCCFGAECIFGSECVFSNYCTFSDDSVFCDHCIFGVGCALGKYCRFGKRCRFEWACSFGERCSFGSRCSHEGLTNSIYVAIDRIGSELRKTYFFKAEEGYFVRAGCFFGTLDEFKGRVHETHGGTIHETTYLMACDLAVKLLDSQYEDVK